MRRHRLAAARRHASAPNAGPRADRGAWRGAPRSGSRRCSGKPSRWRSRNAACSPNCASSRSIARSRSRSSRRSSATARRAGEAGAATRRSRSSCRATRNSSGPTSRRGWCSSTRWDAPATGGCCSTSTTCAKSGAPTGPPPRSDGSIAIASRNIAARSPRWPRSAPACRRGRRNSPRCRSGRRTRRVAVERAVTARANLVKSIDERRDLNAQLTGELQDAQQKLQATLSAAAAGRPAARRTCRSGPSRARCPGPPTASCRRGSAGSPRTARDRRSGTASNCRCPKGSRSGRFTAGRSRTPTSSPATPTSSLSSTATGPTRFTAICRRLSVKKGDRVEAGTTVGTAGRNPAGNPALYFELRVDGKPVDPLQWLKR